MFTKLSSSFFVDFDKSLLEDLPEIIHTYGTDQPVIEQKHWMTYDKPTIMPDADHGSISFTGHTYRFLPKFTDDVHDRLHTFVNGNIKWDKQRIRLIRTRGFILPHRDEARTSCINIGLVNSNSAITRFGNTDSVEDFNEPFNTTDFICQDGDVYLLDVKKMHAVYPLGINNNDRLLITYAFSNEYDQLKKYLAP